MEIEHNVRVEVLDLKETIYTDQRGQFPFMSSKVNHYVMVAIHVDADEGATERVKRQMKKTLIANAVFTAYAMRGRCEHYLLVDSYTRLLYMSSLWHSCVISGGHACLSCESLI